MTALTLHDDFLAMRARFHRALAISVGVHALLALGLLLADEARPDLPRIIEVTWLEPVDVPEPAPVAVTPREVRPAEPAEPARELPKPRVAVRPRPDPAVAETAARARAATQKRQAQLAALAATRGAVAQATAPLPASAAARQLLAGAPAGGSDLTRVAGASMMPVAATGRPVALARGPEGGGAALALNRGPAVAGGSGSLAAAVAGAGIGRGDIDGEASGSGTASATRAAAAVRGGGSAGDILIEGPAADRPVVASVMPAYPDWARRQAVEAAVTLQFTVLPDGRVREDVRIEKTGGFRDFDDRAVAALRQWRFASLAGGDAAGQWGTITFRFRLRG